MYEKWEAFISAGNQAFENRQWNDSLSHYDNALSEARTNLDMLLSGEDVDRALLTVLISFFNIADTYRKMDNCPSAIEVYTQCFQYLGEQYRSSPGKEKLQSAVLSAYSRARAEWLLLNKHFEENTESPGLFELQRVEKSLVFLQHQMASPAPL